MKKFLLIAGMLILTACGTDEEQDVPKDDNGTNDEPVEEAVINVPDDYETISAAIENASDGDEIVLAEGTYQEDLNFDGKDIVLTSTDPEDTAVVANTVIEGTGNGPVFLFDSGESSAAKVTGFTITGGNCENGGAISVAPMTTQTSPTITYNVFEGNTAEFGGAIYLQESTSEITNNEFEDNTASSYGGAIYVSSANVLIADNYFKNNDAESFGGALRIELASPSVRDNVFESNTAYWGGGAVSVGSDSDPEFSGNQYEDNDPANEDYE